MPIILDNVSYTYQPGTPNEVEALKQVNLKIKSGQFIGVIGHTGSGKSTLIQHLNGLLFPQEGSVTVDGLPVVAKSKDLKEIRRKVGLVFQYPEYQLFEETVALDIAFGPKSLGLAEEEIRRRVRWAMKMVDLDYETFKEQSPFGLSGGEKRRVAIAGVLAMQPKYLVLDEPCAGLDPQGRDEILGQLKRLNEKDWRFFSSATAWRTWHGWRSGLLLSIMAGSNMMMGYARFLAGRRKWSGWGWTYRR